MNRSSKKATTSFKYRLSKDITKNKPTKLTVETVKIPEKKEDEKKIENTITVNKEQEDQNNKNRIIHNNNLSVIQVLQEKLDKLEEENKLINDEVDKIKEEEKDMEEKFEQIKKEIEEETGNLEELKDINDEKNTQLARILHLRHQQIAQNANLYNNQNNRESERERERPSDVLNHFTLGEVMDGILRITNINRESNEPPQFPFIFIPNSESNEEGPPMSYQQLQALPSYSYQGRNSNEKCNICDFDLCYNDLVTRLSKCNHIFHKNCLINRLSTRRSSKCPNCKKSII